MKVRWKCTVTNVLLELKGLSNIVIGLVLEANERLIKKSGVKEVGFKLQQLQIALGIKVYDIGGVDRKVLYSIGRAPNVISWVRDPGLSVVI